MDMSWKSSKIAKFKKKRSYFCYKWTFWRNWWFRITSNKLVVLGKNQLRDIVIKRIRFYNPSKSHVSWWRANKQYTVNIVEKAMTLHSPKTSPRRDGTESYTILQLLWTSWFVFLFFFSAPFFNRRSLWLLALLDCFCLGSLQAVDEGFVGHFDPAVAWFMFGLCLYHSRG